MTISETYRTLGLSGIRQRQRDIAATPALLGEYQIWLAEIMPIARSNLETIAANLRTYDYRFGNLPDDPAYWSHLPVFSGATSPTLINAAQALVGGFPKAVGTFCSDIGGVTFLGYHPDWPTPEILDAFSFEGLNEEYLVFLQDEFYAYAESDAMNRSPFFLCPFAPDRYHKANISGGAPYSILCDPDDLEGQIIFLEKEPVLFFDYLNRVFRWGGFPGLEFASDEERSMVPLTDLTQGVQLL